MNKIATIGFFDGVHLGHSYLLEQLKSEAQQRGMQSVVVTFSNHPRLFFDPNCGLKQLTLSEEKLDLLIENINMLENALYEQEIVNLQDYVGIESFAKFYIVNEIMANGELNHPKSSYFTFDSETKILSAGPVWDFDWAGATSSASFIIKNTIYYDRLFKDEEFCATVEELLDSENLTQSKIENKIEEMRNQISSSVALDNLIWGKHNNPVGNQFDTFDEYVDNLTQCIGTRINYLKDIDF